MTNQMRKMVFAGFISSIISLVACSIAFIINNFSYVQIVSYVILAINLVLCILLGACYFKAKKDAAVYKTKIRNAKLLIIYRDNAVRDFYTRHNLKPQYDRNGKLLTPDEFIGIITKLDENGNIDPSIYDMLGIEPVFDENGHQVPIIIVLKHLIKQLKKDNLKAIPKLKGLYAKGTKQEKQVDKPAKDKKQDKKDEKKKADKKAEKVKIGVGKEVKTKNSVKKVSSSKPEKKDTPKQEAQKQKDVQEETKQQNTEVVSQNNSPIIEPAISGNDYLNNLSGGKKQIQIINPQKTTKIAGDEGWEATQE